jgi:pilus assembly protein Flp/PilA
MDETPLTSAPHQLLTRNGVTGCSGRGPEEGGVDAIRRNFRRLRTDQKGATAIEYGLIAALIVIAMMGGLRAMGGGAGGMWSNISQAVQNS